MANIDCLVPFILKWEGGFVDDPADRGGATNMGVTISTWQGVGCDKNGDGKIDSTDLRLITTAEVVHRVLKPYYWDRWRADQIENQSVANILVDWVWASGRWGIVIPQRMIGVVDDGVVGRRTIAAINTQEAKALFDNVKSERMKFIDQIISRDPTQKKFEKGWKNRINDFKF